jgi:hypothetical protein
MNSVGIGSTVGLGTIIGLGIVAPNASITEYAMTFIFYGGLTAFLIELYRFAFRADTRFRR